MAARADLKTVISADMTGFSATMRRAGVLAKTTGGAIGRSIGSATKAMGRLTLSAGKAGLALGAVGAAVGGAAFIRGIKNAADLGGQLSDVSARTGILAGDLAVMGRAFEDNGVSADKVGGIINKLQRTISDFGVGTETARRPFERLGISFDEISRLDPAAQFQLIQSKIAALKSPTDRAATAMEIFGRSGGELLTLFADGQAFSGAARFLGTQAEILNRSSGVFDSISDKLARIPAKLQGFFVGFLEPIAGDIDGILTRFDQIDFAAIGLRFSSAFSVDNLIKTFSAAVPLIVAVLADAFTKALDVAGALFRAFFSPEGLTFLKNAMVDTFVAAFDAIGGAAYELAKTIGAALKGEVRMQDKTRIIGTEKPEDAPRDFASRLEGELEKIDWAPSKAVKDAADKFGATIGQIFPDVVKKGVSESQADIYDAETKAQRERVENDTRARNTQDGTLFGPPKPMIPAMETFGPSKSLKDRVRLFGERGQALGGDNAFARDRARMGMDGLGGGGGRWSGVANASTTGGLGEKRRLRTSADGKDAKKNLSLQEQQVGFLEGIDKKIGQSLSVN
jgi:hypothetical protein